MSSINNVGGSSPIQNVTPTAKPAAASAPAASTPTRAADRVELSGISQFISAAKSGGIRQHQVDSIKSQIAAGTYDANEEKLNASLDRLLDDINNS